MLATYLTMREHYHFSVVSERLTQNSPKVAEWTGAIGRNFAAQGASPDAAHMQALAQLQGMLALFLIPKPRQAGTAAAH